MTKENLVEWRFGRFKMAQMDSKEKSLLALLEERFIEGVGFPHRPGGGFRPDATCWAILALRAAGSTSGVIDRARRLLVNAQGADGRVCVWPQRPDACWPTPLAVLAWHSAPEFDGPRAKAARFLLEFDQIGVLDGSQPGEGHDPTIKGWPWTAKAHPWVEPTAYLLLALRACGQESHDRAEDAVRLLIDRQLATGGWNVGTTISFGQQTWPTPEATGAALQALAGLVSRLAVEQSITYLRSQLPVLNAPMSLGWAILGLHAWQETIERPQERILQVLKRQERFGPYDTFALSLLLLAWHCQAGVVRYLENQGQTTEKI
jgi:hypothetical protein